MAYSRIKRRQVLVTETQRNGNKVKKEQTRYYASIMWEGRELGLGSYLTKEASQQSIVRAQYNIASGLDPRTHETQSVTMNELWNMMLATCIKNKKWRPRTVHRNTLNYQTHIAPEFGERKLSSITHNDIQLWVNKLCDKKAKSKTTNLSPSTVDGIYRQLRHMFNEAVAREYIEKSPVIRITKPSPSNAEIDCLFTEEIEKVLAVMDIQLSTYFSILAYAGLRAGEGLALKGKKIDFVNKKIYVTHSWSDKNGYAEPKTEAGKRTVPMLPVLEKRLRQYFAQENIGDEDFLFRSPKPTENKPYMGFGRQLKKALNLAGVRPVTVHSFRHSFISLMISNGASIVAASRIAGHQSIEITLRRYAHLVPQDLDNAIARANHTIEDVLSEIKGKGGE